VAGGVVAARDQRRVAEGRGPAGVQRDGRARRRPDRRLGLGDHGLLGRAALVNGVVVVAVADVADRPGIGAGHGAGGRQRVAGAVGAVAVAGQRVVGAVHLGALHVALPI